MVDLVDPGGERHHLRIAVRKVPDHRQRERARGGRVDRLPVGGSRDTGHQGDGERGGDRKRASSHDSPLNRRADPRRRTSPPQGCSPSRDMVFSGRRRAVLPGRLDSSRHREGERPILERSRCCCSFSPSRRVRQLPPTRSRFRPRSRRSRSFDLRSARNAGLSRRRSRVRVPSLPYRSPASSAATSARVELGRVAEIGITAHESTSLVRQPVPRASARALDVRKSHESRIPARSRKQKCSPSGKRRDGGAGERVEEEMVAELLARRACQFLIA